MSTRAVASIRMSCLVTITLPIWIPRKGKYGAKDHISGPQRSTAKPVITMDAPRVVTRVGTMTLAVSGHLTSP